MHERVDQAGVKIGAARRKAAFVFIFATILLDMLAMGVIIPVLPKLVVDFVGGDTQEAARIFGSSARPGHSCNSCSRRCREPCPIVSGDGRLSSCPISVSALTMC
jgi:hypothetical protein